MCADVVVVLFEQVILIFFLGLLLCRLASHFDNEFNVFNLVFSF